MKFLRQQLHSSFHFLSQRPVNTHHKRDKETSLVGTGRQILSLFILLMFFEDVCGGLADVRFGVEVAYPDVKNRVFARLVESAHKNIAAFIQNRGLRRGSICGSR